MLVCGNTVIRSIVKFRAGRDVVNLVQGWRKSRATVNTEKNLRAPYNAGNFWTMREPATFSRRTAVYGFKETRSVQRAKLTESLTIQVTELSSVQGKSQSNQKILVLKLSPCSKCKLFLFG